MTNYLDIAKHLEKLTENECQKCSAQDSKQCETCKTGIIIKFLESIYLDDRSEPEYVYWEKDPNEARYNGEIYDYRCSKCKEKAHKGIYGNNDLLSNFCPFCGAMMKRS